MSHSIPHHLRFGASLHINLPQRLDYHGDMAPLAQGAPDPKEVFQEIATAAQHGDEFQRSLAAIPDKKDPIGIFVDIASKLHLAKIDTRHNGSVSILRKENEPLIELIRRTLVAATEKAKTLVSFEEHQETQRQLITQAITGFQTALTSGALQKVKLESTTQSGSSGFPETIVRVKAGEREYLVVKEDIAYTGGKKFPNYRVHWLDNGVNYYMTFQEYPTHNGAGEEFTSFGWNLQTYKNPFPLPHLNLLDQAKELFKAMNTSTLFDAEAVSN